MKFWEAMREVESGKKTHCPSWDGVIKWHVEKIDGRAEILSENGRPGIDFSVYLYECMSREWDILQEPRLSFQDVVKGLKEGKKYRRGRWNPFRESIRMGASYAYIRNENAEKSGFSVEDFEATDWVEVK